MLCRHLLRVCNRSAGTHSRYIYKHHAIQYDIYAYFSSHSKSTNHACTLQSHRTIGIIAHIDAGKTTTTERLLYYSGKIKQLGNVDSGSTTTDYLPIERERGITIQSAAITYQWDDHTVTLIDTPGHVDFTVEVEQSVRVCDGIVCIVDSVKGVEAQTITVWKQKQYYNIASVIFINKMDRIGTDYIFAVQSIQQKLNVNIVELQIPVYTSTDTNTNRNSTSITPSQQSEFIGVIDLVTLKQYQWNSHRNKFDDGRKYEIIDIDSGYTQYDEIIRKREEMIDMLCGHDDILTDLYLNADSHLQLYSHDIQHAIRRCTVNRTLVPVLCGASLRNTGVQLLLDAINSYLPSPLDIPYINGTLLNNKQRHIHNNGSNQLPTLQRQCTAAESLCALAFKVIHDTARGNQPVVYVRVYSGVLNQRDQLINTWQTHLQHKSRSTTTHKDDQVRERIQKIYDIDADHNIELPSISAGHIAALIGLRHTRTGDTLCHINDKQPIYLPGINTPQPVFSRSIEVSSITQQQALDTALKCIVLEDPSIRVSVDTDSGQTHLSGMGELHIEIVYNKLIEQYKIECELGPIRVAYKESISHEYTYMMNYSGIIANQQAEFMIDISVAPLPSGTGNKIIFNPQCDTHKVDDRVSMSMTEEIHDTIENTIESCLYRGSILGYNMIDIQCTVNHLYISSSTTIASINYATSKCIQYCIEHSTPILLEPIMSCHIAVDQPSLGDIINDLTSRRRAAINTIGSNHSDMTLTTIDCDVPLVDMIGYSTELRSRTSGNGSFTMEFNSYKQVDAYTAKQLIEKN